jgi:hypothetical protein
MDQLEDVTEATGVLETLLRGRMIGGVMLIELEPAAPDFERYSVTGGGDDFRRASWQWEAQHVGCGDGHSTDHLTVDEPSDRSGDGIRRVWFHCACGQRRLVLGPPAGGSMEPPFPRRGMGLYVRTSRGVGRMLVSSLPDGLRLATQLRADRHQGAVWIERSDHPANEWTADEWWAWKCRRDWSIRPPMPGVH